MSACGDVDDCISTPEAAELAEKFDEKEINNLPRPGQVDFINGGPPCQVRFGILEAGTYGVSQSRKCAFIWAASPEEQLPGWPEPMHVFASPELKVKLSEDTHYAAVRSPANGSPFRSITVRDTIGDLPAVGNGASVTTMYRKVQVMTINLLWTYFWRVWVALKVVLGYCSWHERLSIFIFCRQAKHVINL